MPSRLRYVVYYRLGGCGPAIKLGADTIKASEHVRVLGVTMSSDLSLEKHVSAVSAACFFLIHDLLFPYLYNGV